MNSQSIQNRIRSKRKSLSITQEEMAGKLGISSNSYRDVENGRTAIIYHRLPAIASILDITLEELIIGKQSEESLAVKEANEKASELQSKIRIMDEQHKIEVAELMGKIEELETTIKSKKQIIDILKEKNHEY